MRPCINDCGQVAEHGPYCHDCAQPQRKEKRKAACPNAQRTP